MPLGTDCAPMLADPVNINNSIQLARKFTNTMRHIDDLLILNNSSFEKEIPNIKTNKRESIRATYHTYLDVTIKLDSITTVCFLKSFLISLLG